MTQPPQPRLPLLQCETCEHNQGREWQLEGIVNVKKVKCEKKGLVRYNNDCASHSDFTSAEVAIRKMAFEEAIVVCRNHGAYECISILDILSTHPWEELPDELWQQEGGKNK